MRSFMFSALLVAIGHLGSTTQTRPEPDFEALPFAPRQFVCYRPSGSLTIDGRLDEPSWKAAAWTDPFVDILGDRAPRPRFATRAKMLWDDDYFYFAADIEEPHLWATLTARDSVIFQDNDFEIFIDPDGDTHNYFELEINAFATLGMAIATAVQKPGTSPASRPRWTLAARSIGRRSRHGCRHP